MNNKTQTQLFALFDRQKKIWQESKQSLPLHEVDSDWPSQCLIGDVIDGKCEWQAVQRTHLGDMSNIEAALKIQLHPTLIDFFCSAYADHIPCLFQDHPIDLIQVWNETDFKQLQENMIAHFMMQKRLKQPASMFIASCSDEMQIISVLNETGQVQLENLGKGQERLLAESLPEFLSQLTPLIVE
jgi:SecY interacting protein Syd